MSQKNAGLNLFATELGGRSEVWQERPLAAELISYAASDVQFLFEMKDRWGRGLNTGAVKMIVE